MTFQCLQVQREGPVEYLTLNRPDVRNAFNDQVIEELTRWATAIADDSHVRCVVLSGAGKTFCAGADLTWMSKTVAFTHEENLRDAEAMARMFSALDTLPVPLVGRIHGAALGGGAGLVAVCDVVVADEDTLFGFTEVKLGILPSVISPYAIAKIGRSAARELFLTGMRFGAAHAREVGLVHRVVPSSRLAPTVKDYVTEILSAGPQGVTAAKRLIPKVWNQSAQDTMSLTVETIATQRVSAEGQEGMRAFLEKRKANWNLS